MSCSSELALLSDLQSEKMSPSLSVLSAYESKAWTLGALYTQPHLPVPLSVSAGGQDLQGAVVQPVK